VAGRVLGAEVRHALREDHDVARVRGDRVEVLARQQVGEGLQGRLVVLNRLEGSKRPARHGRRLRTVREVEHDGGLLGLEPRALERVEVDGLQTAARWRRQQLRRGVSRRALDAQLVQQRAKQGVEIRFELIEVGPRGQVELAHVAGDDLRQTGARPGGHQRQQRSSELPAQVASAKQRVLV